MRRLQASRPIARTGLTGAAGEYHVAAELSRRGWLATVTIKNAPGTDVLAQHADTGHVVAIQSKTIRGSGNFMLNAACETPTKQSNDWYVLVGLRGLDDRPDFWLMPRNHVAALVYVGHRRWLSGLGRSGKSRRDSNIRGITRAEIDSYQERWDTLLRPTTKVKYAMPDWFSEAVREHPLPDGHPDARRFAAG